MIIKIQGEQPFQVLSTNFTISASESGYDLYFSADGVNYSKLFTVGANVNRQVTQVAAGSYYYLEGNTDTVTVNWIANCYSGGEGGGGTQYTAGNGIQISGSNISVKAGEGLAFSGDTLVVSGGTGGGIEKVTELPANPEEGDIVQLYVSGKTVQTIAMEMTNSEKSFESGYQVAVINGNGFECDGYGTQYGKWLHDYRLGFDVYFRNRRDANYRYFDFDIDPSEIEVGADADTLTETQIPGYYQIWAFENGAWKQIDREIVFDPEYDGSFADFFWRVYSGVNFIDGDYITFRIKDNGDNKREFKPYDFRYYGMDCQATDGRGAEDGYFGQIGIETIRVNNDGYGTLTQKEYTAKAGDIPSIGPASFGNDWRGGLTYDADNDQFLYDNGTVSTGDTSNYVEDVIDFAYLSSLFNRDGKYDGFRFIMNSHVLNVQSNGETHYYAQPSLAKKPITGYTIGDYTFVWEFTFKYIDYVLKIDAPDGTNIGANLRITQA